MLVVAGPRGGLAVLVVRDGALVDKLIEGGHVLAVAWIPNSDEAFIEIAQAMRRAQAAAPARRE